MSGGRFDYYDSSLMSEMFGYLDDGDPIPNVMEDMEISELTYDLLTLIHDYDWYVSGDTGKETYLRAKELFKNKWLQNNKDLRLMRLQRIIDDAVDGLRDELYETIGVKEQEHE